MIYACIVAYASHKQCGISTAFDSEATAEASAKWSKCVMSLGSQAGEGRGLSTLNRIMTYYHTILSNPIQYSTIHNTNEYNTVQYTTIQYNTVQYNAITYNTTQYNTIQRNTIQDNTIQYNTMQYNTIQYSTVQYNTRQEYISGFIRYQPLLLRPPTFRGARDLRL